MLAIYGDGDGYGYAQMLCHACYFAYLFHGLAESLGLSKFHFHQLGISWDTLGLELNPTLAILAILGHMSLRRSYVGFG